MNRNQTWYGARWRRVGLVGLILAVPLLWVFEIAQGSGGTGIWKSLELLFSSGDDSAGFIIRQLRFPRAMTALFVGASLGVSGLLMQTFFRNPLAGPFELGVSAGAGLGVAMALLASGTFAWVATSRLGIVFPAILGAALALSLIMVMAPRVRDAASLLVLGVMLSSLASAMVGLLQFHAEADRLQAFVHWGLGSVAGVTLQDLPWLIGLIGVGLGGAFLLSKPLDAYLLGELEAQGLGHRLSRLRFAITISICLPTAMTVAYCGPIAFIGLGAPHLARAVLPSTSHRMAIPIAALVGADLLLFCDGLTRWIGQGASLPLNSVTAALGAPLVMAVILRGRGLTGRNL